MPEKLPNGARAAWQDAVRDRISQRKLALGLSQRVLGARLGVSGSAVAQWMGRESSFASWRTLAKLAKELRVSTDWLLGLAPEMQGPAVERVIERTIEVPVESPPEEWSDFRRRPYVGEIALGPGHDLDLTAEPTDHYAFRLGWFARLGVRPEDVRLFKVSRDERFGTPMEPTISRGALLAVDTRELDHLRSGSIYLVRRPEEGLTVKRLFRPDPGTVVVWADNPGYPERVVAVHLSPDDGERLSSWVKGRVVWYGAELVPPPVSAQRKHR